MPPPSTSPDEKVPELRRIGLQWEVWGFDPIPAHRRWIGGFVRGVKRLYLLLLAPFHRELLRRQRSFNVSIVAALERLESAVARLAAEAERQDRTLQGANLKIQEVRRELAARRFEAASAPVGTEPPSPTPSAPAGHPKWADHFYCQFENEHRGTEDEIRSRQRSYVDRFAASQAAGPVVDFGCGRGEFLDLLRDRGIRGVGVEGNEAMAGATREKGLEVVFADGLSYLRGVPAGSLRGLFAAQVIEHLTPAELLELARLSFEKVGSGGVVIFESLNPRSWLAVSKIFWLDPSHVRPYDPEGVRVLLEHLGFAEVETSWLSAVGSEGKLEPLAEGAEEGCRGIVEGINRNLHRLDELLFAPLEYAIVARR